MRHVLRFCMTTGHVAFAAVVSALVVMFYPDYPAYVLHGAVTAIILYALAIVFDLHSKVRRCYLDTTGRILRKPNYALSHCLYFTVFIVALVYQFFVIFSGTYWPVNFWLGIAILLICGLCHVFLLAYVMVIKIGHRLGLIKYRKPQRRYTSILLFTMLAEGRDTFELTGDEGMIEE